MPSGKWEGSTVDGFSPKNCWLGNCSGIVELFTSFELNGITVLTGVIVLNLSQKV
jgi:hypothetical protein